MGEQEGQKPDIEIRRKIGPGHYRTYGDIYFRPLRVFLFGRWIIGGKKVREAWNRAAGGSDDG